MNLKKYPKTLCKLFFFTEKYTRLLILITLKCENIINMRLMINVLYNKLNFNLEFLF